MEKYKFLLPFLFLVFYTSCSDKKQTEKHQARTESVTNIQERIIKIEADSVLIGRANRTYIFGKYLVISDSRSPDKLVHIFDKRNFDYITSIVDAGSGPEEISNMGTLGIPPNGRILYIPDHGKRKVFKYNLDSISIVPLHPSFGPLISSSGLFPDRYQFINDSSAIGIIIEPIGVSDFKQSLGKWNVNSGKIEVIPTYSHPDIEKKRITFAVSEKDSLLVECYTNNDLMTISDLNGNTKYNIYGPNWDTRKSSIKRHFRKVIFCNDKIVANYDGNKQDSNGGFTQFLIFDLNGNYLKTLETNYIVHDFCFDEENERIIMSLDTAEDIQFAYFDVDGII